MNVFLTKCVNKFMNMKSCPVKGFQYSNDLSDTCLSILYADILIQQFNKNNLAYLFVIKDNRKLPITNTSSDCCMCS